MKEYWSKTLQEGSVKDNLAAPPEDETLPSPINVSFSLMFTSEFKF